MADTGYFDSVSANLKTGVGAQVKGISEGVKANSDAGVSPSVNALDTGVKAAAAIGGLADGLPDGLAATLVQIGHVGEVGGELLPGRRRVLREARQVDHRRHQRRAALRHLGDHVV